MDKPRIVNLNELPEAKEHGHDGRFAVRFAPVAAALGARKLGYNVTEVPPGKKSFPYHFHYANEEMFLILSGQGELRWPGGTRPVKPMDLVACPPGADGAHQFINNGNEPLRYLAVSTVEDPEVVDYPDSGKYGAVAGRPIGGMRADAKFGVIAFKKDGVDYWAGE
jgi:uncharacterized cupin superfamily protein